MMYSAYVSSTPFTLADPIEDSVMRIQALVHQAMDDYPIDLEQEVDGRWTISMLDTHDVGDSFEERVERLVKAICPYVTCAFEVLVRNCDSPGDDRDTFYYGGPDERSIEIFKKLQTVADVRELLTRIHMDEHLIAQIDALLHSAIVGAEPEKERSFDPGFSSRKPGQFTAGIAAGITCAGPQCTGARSRWARHRS